MVGMSTRVALSEDASGQQKSWPIRDACFRKGRSLRMEPSDRNQAEARIHRRPLRSGCGRSCRAGERRLSARTGPSPCAAEFVHQQSVDHTAQAGNGLRNVTQQEQVMSLLRRLEASQGPPAATRPNPDVLSPRVAAWTVRRPRDIRCLQLSVASHPRRRPATPNF